MTDILKMYEELCFEIGDEMAGGPPGRETKWPQMLETFVAAVREDERQKMYELWKGMIP